MRRFPVKWSHWTRRAAALLLSPLVLVVMWLLFYSYGAGILILLIGTTAYGRGLTPRPILLSGRFFATAEERKRPQIGDVIEIETPGGFAYPSACDDPKDAPVERHPEREEHPEAFFFEDEVCSSNESNTRRGRQNEENY